MFDSDILEKLKEHYPVHPLIFLRSVEKAKDLDDLLEILKNIPSLPIIWDHKKRRWSKIGM